MSRIELIDPTKKARVEEIEALIMALEQERDVLLHEIGRALSGPVSAEAIKWANQQIELLELNNPGKRAEMKTRPFSEFRAEAIKRGFGPSR